jgi:hypothetical protein
MGDDGAGVLLETVPSATPPHARNAPSSRPKGDGDKRKALPYAQLLSQVQRLRSAGPQLTWSPREAGRSLLVPKCSSRARSRAELSVAA